MHKIAINLTLPNIYFVISLFLLCVPYAAWANVWKAEWPRTDFSKYSVALNSIISGGPPRDGIRSIDNPRFTSVAGFDVLVDTEPVMSLHIDGEARAYPIRILMYHEIVNDVIGDMPLAITYCPLCNTSIVFKAVVKGKPTTFGTTGKLRHSDMVMYDRQTESWWQQFTGEAIVGEMTGHSLELVPSRLESYGLFKKRHPKGKVLLAPASSYLPYGRNPYVGYDRLPYPMLYRGEYKGELPALARVVVVQGRKAWALTLLRKQKVITDGDLRVTWKEGQNSALDTSDITQGRDIGTIIVQQKTDDGTYRDIEYKVTFAFAVSAFYENLSIITRIP